jgi:Holliday junction resolvase RusA-like endonuclease
MARTAAATSKAFVERDAERICITLPLDPVPASRPRFRVMKSKGGTPFVGSPYYEGRYKTFLAEAKASLPRFASPLAGRLKVQIVLIVSRPKTTKRITPKGDVDNYAKGVLDVLTDRGLWNDDDQVAFLTVEKYFADAGAAGEIWICVEEIPE